jgi:hypothetical protein
MISIPNRAQARPNCVTAPGPAHEPFDVLSSGIPDARIVRTTAGLMNQPLVALLAIPTVDSFDMPVA